MRETFTGALTPTEDGGCIWAANTFSNDGWLKGRQNPKRSQQYQDNWIVRLDARGDTLWTLTVDGKGNGFAFNRISAIRELADHGFMLVGVGLTNPGNFFETRARLIKVSASGQIEWDKGYVTDRGGANLNLNTDFDDGIPTADNGFIAVGRCTSELITAPPMLTTDLWIVKVDKAGTKIWEKIVKQPFSEFGFKLVQLTADQLIIACSNAFFPGPPVISQTLLYKINTFGELAAGWPLALNRPNSRLLANPAMAVSRIDTTVVLLERYGNDSVGQTIVRMTKLKANQSIVWQKELPVSSGSQEVGHIGVLPDGRLVVGHFSELNINPCNVRSLQLWDNQANMLQKIPVTRIGVNQLAIGHQGAIYTLGEGVSDPTCFPDQRSYKETDIYIASYCAPVFISYTGSTTFCRGEALTLTANVIEGATYQWHKNGNPISGATNRVFISSESGDYTVSTVYQNCESLSDRVAVEVMPLPKAVVAPPATATVCSGDTIRLQAKTDPDSRYQWLKDGIPVPGATGPFLLSIESGTYTVLVSQGTCRQESAGLPLYFKPLPPAVATSNSPVACLHTIRLRAQPDQAQYQWTGPNRFRSALQHPVRCLATPSKLGEYRLTVTDPATGCSQRTRTLVTFKPKK